MYFWLSISLSNSNVWIKSRIFESINKTDLMSHCVSQFMSQFWIRSFTRRSLIFGKLSFRIFRLQSREMEFQMNWIPINSCDFFIWHSISRDSESVQFERHSNCRHVNLAEGTCSSGLTCLFWNSKCLSKCLDFLFAVESLWRTTGFWVYQQSREVPSLSEFDFLVLAGSIWWRWTRGNQRKLKTDTFTSKDDQRQPAEN